MMRKLSFKNLLAFAVFCFFGANAIAQTGVTITDQPVPPDPRSMLDVRGDVRIETIPIGGRDILTWEATDNNNSIQQIRRIEIPDPKSGQTIVWDATTNSWKVGNPIMNVDPAIFDTTGGILKLRTPQPPDAGQIIIWDGTKWVIQQGGGGGRGNYVAESPIRIGIRPGGQGPDTIALSSAGLQPGQTWIWNGRAWVPGSASGGWLVGGNPDADVVDETDFLGTIGPDHLYIRTNNIERMRILSNGQIVAGRLIANGRDQFSVYSTGQNFSVVGYANGLTGATYPTEGGGVAGVGNVYGVYGSAEATTGATSGVLGESYSNSDNATGVFGASYGTEATYGVWGQTSTTQGLSSGVLGVAVETQTNNATFGVRGQTFSSQSGSAGVQGVAQNGATAGVIGANSSETSLSQGVLGISVSQGQAGGTYYGVMGLGRKACEAIGVGVYGEGSTYGILGRAAGCTPQGNNLVYSIFGQGNIGASGVKTFHIDHPSDPSNKYLNHAAIESNEALNLYSGNITTDANGEATVTLPAYVQQINKDFRYTLTCMGQLANAVVLKKLENNRFVIKTDKPNVEVSWLLTAQRNDPYMQKYPFQAEVEKPSTDKGKYLHPELYNQPENKGIFYNPEIEKYTTKRGSVIDTKPVIPRRPLKSEPKK
jgi:hypothetical protein